MLKYYKYIMYGLIGLIIYIIVISIYIGENESTIINYSSSEQYTIYLSGEVTTTEPIIQRKGSKLGDFIYDYLTSYADLTSFDKNEEIENNNLYTIGYIDKVNINTASKKELMASLENVGSVRADNIINGRPYSKISDLLTNLVVGSDLYENIENHIMV